MRQKKSENAKSAEITRKEKARIVGARRGRRSRQKYACVHIFSQSGEPNGDLVDALIDPQKFGYLFCFICF